MTYTVIRGGTVYDPTNGVNGVARDIWIADGKIVEPPTDESVRPSKTIDARGCVVFAGGIDMHSHFAGPKANVARKMRPEEKRHADVVRGGPHGRAGHRCTVPNAFVTGNLYAGLGYTTAFDAAVPALFARHAHEEMQDTPCIDKGFLALGGNNHYIMDRIREQADDRLDGFVAWLVRSAKAYGIKVVNPGGIEEWKEDGRRTIADLDDVVHGFDVSPRQILRGLAASLDRLGMPHPMHVHCNNLGAPGNAATTLESMRAMDGHRAHMAHIQFHSYGGDPNDAESFSSAVPQLIDYVKKHEKITLDVGHVTFGPTTSLTGDGPLGYFLHRVTGNKWYSSDTEMETGCGIVPIEYRRSSLVHSIQWAVGLEWYLLLDDPWRMALSTDHPNGGTFWQYPQTIALLMNADRRREAIAAAHPKLRERTVLGDITREYSLYDIAILTRAAPARLLGLAHKGHLGIGADADIAIYQPQADIAAMFALPRYTIKAGEVVFVDGEFAAEIYGTTIHAVPPAFDGAEAEIKPWFDDNYSIRFGNYPVDMSYLPTPYAVRCGANTDLPETSANV